MQYDVLSFGAVGDGTHDDTAAIQAAIDTCCQNGGGRVTLPGGRVYRTGVLRLGSHMEFHLEAGAVLKGSDNLEDYRLFGGGSDIPQKRDVPSYVNCEYAGAPPITSCMPRIARTCPLPAGVLSTATRRFFTAK